MMRHEVVLQEDGEGRWLRFRAPQEIIEAHRSEDVLPQLRLIETAVNQQGLYAAGFMSYEAAPGFDPAYRVRPSISSLPLLWFGLYRPEDVVTALPDSGPESYTLGEWRPSISREAYGQAIASIKSHIAQGDSYQVNYTFRLRAPFEGNSWRLFLDLIQAQQTQHAAYVNTGRFAICSASPELFFELAGERLSSRPMKGTAARGRTLAEDKAQAEWLRHSEKNQAENVMIVDMIRNDMGRIAQPGSVQVPHLFQVERYPTLWQMTSTVTAQTAVSLTDILTALFPCASITGAPKVRTMQIIADLETDPRDIYTGCIGYMAPGRKARFNVAIRTVLIDQAHGRAEYGVGGGIVWDSVAEEEYEECRIKARILTQSRPDFSLLETLLWENGAGYFLLENHLQRLADSAAYFTIPLKMDQVLRRLKKTAASLSGQQHRVRLIVSREGGISVESYPLSLTAVEEPLRVGLATSPVDPANPFLYHKTTHRQLYETARASRPDCDEVLLWNPQGEVTEASTANLVIQQNGELLTPPISSGLLPGTFRGWLLAQGKIREQVLLLEDLRKSDQIYLINSVRKWREVIFQGPVEV